MLKQQLLKAANLIRRESLLLGCAETYNSRQQDYSSNVKYDDH